VVLFVLCGSDAPVNDCPHPEDSKADMQDDDGDEKDDVSETPESVAAAAAASVAKQQSESQIAELHRYTALCDAMSCY